MSRLNILLVMTFCLTMCIIIISTIEGNKPIRTLKFNNEGQDTNKELLLKLWAQIIQEEQIKRVSNTKQSWWKNKLDSNAAGIKQFFSKLFKKQSTTILEKEASNDEGDLISDEMFGEYTEMLMKLSKDTTGSETTESLRKLWSRLSKLKKQQSKKLEENVLQNILRQGGKSLFGDLNIITAHGADGYQSKIKRRRSDSQSEGKTEEKPIFSKFRYHNTYIIDQKDDLTDSSWVLENVCMSYNGDILFYADENMPHLSKELSRMFYENEDSEPLTEEIFAQCRVNPNYPKCFSRAIADIQAWKRGLRGLVHVKIVKSPLPTHATTIDYVSSSGIPWIEKTVVPVVRYAAGNTGHFLADNLAPWYELITRFGDDPTKTLILFTDEIFYRPCDPDPTTHETDFKLCPEYMSSFLYNKTQTVINTIQWTHLMTKQPILQRCSYKVFEKRSLVDRGAEQDEVVHHHHSKESKPEEKKPKSGTTFVGADGSAMVDTGDIIYRIESAPCPSDDRFSDMGRQKLRTSIIEGTADLKETLGEKPSMCFRKMILGVGDRAMVPYRHHTKFREMTLQGLKKLLAGNLGVPSKKRFGTRRKFIVAIHDKPKTGRHGNSIHNLNEMVKLFNSRLLDTTTYHQYGYDMEKNNFEVEIVPVKLEKLNLIEQVQFFGQVDVYISTIGSGSFYSLFLPEDSFLLYSPECYRPVIQDLETETEEQKRNKKRYICHQPIIHFHTSLTQINVVDIQHTVTDCRFRVNEDGYRDPLKDACDLFYELEPLYQETLHALLLRMNRVLNV